MTDEKQESMPEVRSDEAKISETVSFTAHGTQVGKEKVREERIRVRPFKSATASISMKAGFTKNLGNYESARIDVMLTMPCYPEEIDEVYQDCKDWVDSRIEFLYDEISKGS